MTSPGGNSRQVRVIISADVASAINGFRQVQEGLRGVGEQGQRTTQVTSSFGEKLQQGLANAGVETGFSGIINGFKSIVSSGMDYDKAMNTFQAVTGASTDQMKAAADTAKALGNDVKLPGTTAQGTAAAMMELAKGGLTAQQAMDAARGTMTLAAAASIDGAQAAEIQTNALNAFGLSADQAGHVADVLANTANKSSGDITDFGQALSQSGGVANMFGVSIEDTSTMLGLFANAGLKGSDAGTSLKSAFLAMLNPTKAQQAAIETLGLKIFDAQGNFVGMRSVTEDLGKAQKSLTQETFNTAASQIFGSDAVRAAAFAAQAGVAGFDDISASVTKAGGAQEVAAANAKGLVGALENMTSTAETAGLTLYQTMSPALEKAANFGAFLAEKLGELATWFSTLPGPVQAVSAALLGVVVLRGPMLALSTSMMTFGRNVQMAMTGSTAAIRGAGAGVAGFVLQLRYAQGAMATFGVVAKGALSILGGPIGLAIIGVTTALSFMAANSDDAADSVDGLSAAVDAATGKLTDNAFSLISQDLASRGVLDAYTALGGTVDDFVAALMGVPEAQAKVHEVLEAGRHDSENGGVAWKTYTQAADGYTEAVNKLDTEQRKGAQAATAAAGAQQQAGAAAADGATSVRAAGQAAGSAGSAASGLATTLHDAAAAYQASGSSSTDFKTKVEQSKSAMDSAALAAQGFSLAMLQMQGTDLNAEQASRANDAAMRGMASAARSHAAALDDVAKREQDLEDLRAHGKSSPEALAQAQERLDKATQDAADAQSDLTKQQAQSADDSAKAREALDKTQIKNARSLADAQKALNKATAQSQRDLKDAQAKARDAEAAARAAAADLRKAQTEPDKGAADKLAKARAEAVKTAAALKAVQGEKLTSTTPERHKKDLAAATERAKAAADAVKAAQAGLTGANSDNVAKAKDKVKQTQDALAKANQGVADAKANGSDSVANAEQALKDATESAADARIAAEEAVTKAAESAADAETAAKKRITDASESVQKAQQDLQAVQQASIPTQTDLAAAERAVADAKAQVAASADAQKTAEEAAAQSARDMASAAGETELANGDLEGATKKSTSAMEEQRQKFIDSAVAAGVPRDAAEKLADKYGLIPADVKTTIELQGAEIAMAKAAMLQAMLNKIPEGVYKANITAGFTNIEGTYDPTLQRNRNQRYTNDAGTYDPALQYARNNAAGGFQVGPGGGTDDKILSKLSNGEFVVNAKQTAKHRAQLEAINRGALPGFASGGFVGGHSGKTGNVSMGASVSGGIALPDTDEFRKTWEDIADSVIKPWQRQIQPVLNELTAKAIDTGDSQTTLLNKDVQPAWSGIGQSIGDTWSRVSPMFTGFGAGADEVGAANIRLRDRAVTPSWKGIGATIGSAVTGLQNGLFPQFSNGLSGLGSANDRLAMDTKGSWGRIGASINSAYQGSVVPAWAGVRSFGSAVGVFFDGIAMGSAKAKITMAKDLTEITKAIDGFFKMVDGKTATPGDVGGTIGAAASAAIPTFADGGLITAGTGPRTDDVHIRASKGEYVVNARSTAKNKAALDAINYGGAYGGAYADGGMIGEKIGSRISDAITKGTQRAIEAGVEKAITAGPSYGPGGTVNGVALPGISGPRGKFLEAVASQMGTPYVWGGATPPGFDCSGLMSWALEQAGVGKGRLTAADFNHGFPHISVAKPGDMVTFDTGRIPGDAGHIGAVLDPAKGLMMHTDGAGPARVGDYKSRDGGPLSIIDPIGGAVTPSKSEKANEGDPPSVGWLPRMLERIKNGTFNGGGGGATAKMNTVDPIVDFGARNMERGKSEYVGALPPGSAEDRWAGVYTKALTMKGKFNQANLANMMYQMHTESSGDPLSYNDYDSNYTAGHPSKGLLQTIPSTFRDNAEPGYTTNIWDPLSNALAAVNYVAGKYGGVFPGVAYANGGIVPGGSTPGNDSVLAMASPGEAFLTRNQWTTARAAINHANGAGGRPANVVVNARVFVGDREITDIVRVETDMAMGQLATTVNRMAGQSA